VSSRTRCAAPPLIGLPLTKPIGNLSDRRRILARCQAEHPRSRSLVRRMRVQYGRSSSASSSCAAVNVRPLTVLEPGAARGG
jgi:hypothetical protein